MKRQRETKRRGTVNQDREKNNRNKKYSKDEVRAEKRS